jgi:hypothetical protein
VARKEATVPHNHTHRHLLWHSILPKTSSQKITFVVDGPESTLIVCRLATDSRVG